MVKGVFYLIGLAAFGVGVAAIVTGPSDIQIILGGIFLLVGLVAFGVGKIM